MLRLILKSLKFIFLTFLILFLFAATVIGINFFDTSESALTKKLFNNQQTVPQGINGDAYMRGLQLDVKDPHQYGKMIYALDEQCSPQDSVDDRQCDEYNKSVSFISWQEDPSISFYCWFMDDDTLKEGVRCASETELLSTIEDNKILWDRYHEMMAYKHFDIDIIDPTKMTFRGQDFIIMQSVFQAYLMKLVQEGKSSEAIDLWLKNHQMLNALMSSRKDMVFMAITIIIQNFSDKAILTIANNSKLNALQQKQIEKAMLKPAFGENGMNLKKIYQAGHNFIFRSMKKELDAFRLDEKNIFQTTPPFYAHNHTRNLHAECANSMMKVGSVSYPEFDLALQKHIEKKYDKQPYWIELIYNPIGKLLVPAICTGHQLLLNRHKQTIKRRMIVLAAIAKQNDITTENMAKFIENAPMKLRNPRTGRPFNWDGKNISFTLPDETVEIPYSN